MKIIHSNPILVLSEEEKKILEQAKDILDKITDEDYDIVDKLLEDYGEDSNTMSQAYTAIKGLLEAAITPNSTQAKSAFLSITAGLIID